MESITAAPRRPSARAVALEEHGFTAAGAPTHTRTPPGGDSGLLHILGPVPRKEG